MPHIDGWGLCPHPLNLSIFVAILTNRVWWSAAGGLLRLKQKNQCVKIALGGWSCHVGSPVLGHRGHMGTIPDEPSLPTISAKVQGLTVKGLVSICQLNTNEGPSWLLYETEELIC